MKTIVVYYTYGGATKVEAEKLAKERGADLCRVEERKKRGKFSAMLSGCPKALGRKTTKIKPITYYFNDYDRIIIGGPIWAGFPAPAINAIFDALPSGKEVELFLCSGGGETPKSAQGTKEIIAQKGCKLISYRDIKTGQGMNKAKEE
jgi:flavodoxin